MNITVNEYLNKANQDHREAYNSYIKDQLTSGKPLELDLKDFLPDKPKTKQAVTKKQKHNKPVITIEEMLAHCEFMYDIFHNEQVKARREGNKDKEYDNWKEANFYDMMICKITGREYVCKIPR